MRYIVDSHGNVLKIVSVSVVTRSDLKKIDHQLAKAANTSGSDAR